MGMEELHPEGSALCLACASSIVRALAPREHGLGSTLLPRRRRGYHTDSSHVPAHHRLSAFEKIRIEAPYHELTDAGHITYIEMDGGRPITSRTHHDALGVELGASVVYGPRCGAIVIR